MAMQVSNKRKRYDSLGNEKMNYFRGVAPDIVELIASFILGADFRHLMLTCKFRNATLRKYIVNLDNYKLGFKDWEPLKKAQSLRTYGIKHRKLFFMINCKWVHKHKIGIGSKYHRRNYMYSPTDFKCSNKLFVSKDGLWGKRIQIPQSCGDNHFVKWAIYEAAERERYWAGVRSRKHGKCGACLKMRHITQAKGLCYNCSNS